MWELRNKYSLTMLAEASVAESHGRSVLVSQGESRELEFFFRRGPLSRHADLKLACQSTRLPSTNKTRVALRDLPRGDGGALTTGGWTFWSNSSRAGMQPLAVSTSCREDPSAALHRLPVPLKRSTGRLSGSRATLRAGPCFRRPPGNKPTVHHG